MEFSITELSISCGCSERTFYRRIAKLKKSGIFIKTSLGRFYNENDAYKLAELIGFKLKSLKNENNKNFNKYATL